MSVDKPDGTEDVAGDREDVVAAGEVRGGLFDGDNAGIGGSAAERVAGFGGERTRREASAGTVSDGTVEGSCVASGGQGSVDEGWLFIRCEIVEHGPALRRIVIRPESRCLVFNDRLDGAVVRASRLFGEVVVESKSWRVKDKAEGARIVGEGGQP